VIAGTRGARAIGAGLVVATLIGAQLSLSALAASTASAAGILPPSNPPANITFDVAAPCSSVGDPSAACLETLLHDINAGRSSEGLPSMVLPNGFAQMSSAEQLLVLANLERGARGLAQFAGLSPTLDAVSALAASANGDPSPPAGYPFSQWGSNYADAVDPLESDFLWMYDDGVGGTNYDCQTGNFSGCWGHRTNILGPWANSGSETTAMGDAATAAGAFTEIFANKWGAPDALTVPYSSVTYPGSVAPQVVQVSPAGTTAPGTGTQVTIAGNYFSAFSAGQVPTVHFGSTPATNVHVNWDGQLTADAPPDPLGGQADTVTITVTTPAGTSDASVDPATNAFSYRAAPAPSVISVSPAVGSQHGGTQVTIAGTNLAWATGVAFGSTPAAAYTVNSATSITATAPATAALGPVDVVVTTYGGASARSSADHFDYKLNSTTTPTVSANQSTQGAALTYSAMVSGTGATPTGTVTFRVGSTTLCTTPALVGGAASCRTTATPPGSDTATATYTGDANFAPSSGTNSVVVTSGDFSPLVPTRICDTRSGNPSSLSGPAAQCNGPGNAGSPVGADATKTINVTGNFGVPANATAVLLNVTAVNPAAPGYITAFPTGAAAPNTSNINFGAGDVVPNLVEVGTGTNGDISLFSSAQSNVVVDVEGYVSPTASSGAGAGLYNPLTAPTRVCDTRAGNPSALSGASAQCNGSGGGERLGAGSTMTLQIAGVGGVPANASAAVLNVTVVGPTAAGYLTVFPQGATRPTASNVNYVAGEVTANRVTVPLSSGASPGEISIYSSSSANVVVDVSGYYTAAGGAGSQFTTEVSPVRVCDTRGGDPSQLTGSDTQCGAKTIGANGNLTLQVAGLAGVPAGARAVVVNVTAVSPTMPTYLTVYPGPARTTASDLNPFPGEVRANLTVATVNANGTITVYNSSGSIDVVVDVLGWYA
jgi:Bacterial Ig-like domain (group 3)/IPT/TIG domain